MTIGKKSYAKEGGFSLIELMIVVVVIGVLAAIAYPSFTQYRLKANRSDAYNMLTKIAARQEQFFQDNRRYSNDFMDLGPTTLGAQAVATASVTTEHGYYVITINRPTNYVYTLTATPQGTQTRDSCATLTIDQDGTKGQTLAAGASAGTRCWN